MLSAECWMGPIWLHSASRFDAVKSIKWLLDTETNYQDMIASNFHPIRNILAH